MRQVEFAAAFIQYSNLICKAVYIIFDKQMKE